MIPRVQRGKLIDADEQNALIDQVNQNTEDIENFAVGGDPVAVQEMIDVSLDQHSISPNPHPAYDDIQSLVGLFENGLV